MPRLRQGVTVSLPSMLGFKSEMVLLRVDCDDTLHVLDAKSAAPKRAIPLGCLESVERRGGGALLLRVSTGESSKSSSLRFGECFDERWVEALRAAVARAKQPGLPSRAASSSSSSSSSSGDHVFLLLISVLFSSSPMCGDDRECSGRSHRDANRVLSCLIVLSRLVYETHSGLGDAVERDRDRAKSAIRRQEAARHAARAK